MISAPGRPARAVLTALAVLVLTGSGLVLAGCGGGAPGARFAAPTASPTPKEPNAEPWLLEARRSGQPGKGVWTSMTLPGRRTGHDLPAWVYVQGHMLPILDDLMGRAAVAPMILVSVTQNPQADRDSECVDAVGGAQADTYLSQDVPEAIAAHFRVVTDRKGWSMMGYSTGGYCAVDLALRHPDRFTSAVSLDGYFAPIVDKTTGDLFRGDAAAQRAYTPLRTIQDRRPAALRFYLVVGDAEAKAKQAAGTFAAAVRAPDTVTVVDVPGGHNWDTWNHALPAALTWLAAA